MRANLLCLKNQNILEDYIHTVYSDSYKNSNKKANSACSRISPLYLQCCGQLKGYKAYTCKVIYTVSYNISDIEHTV